MSHDYLFLTPVLTLLIVALVGFVGCDQLFGLDHVDPVVPKPRAPTGFRAEPRDGMIDLWWDIYTGAEKFVVRMGTAEGVHPNAFTVEDGGAIGYTWPGLTNDTTYYFVLTAVVGGVESLPSEEVSGKPGLYGIVMPFLGQTQLGTIRQFDGWMGVRITTGSSDQTLRALGRWFDAAATGMHEVRIAAASNPTAVLATVTVNKAAAAAQGDFVYANLASTIPLMANTQYYVTSRETSAGDAFRDSDQTRVAILDAQAGTDVRAAFGDDAGNYTTAPTAGAAYGPVNLQYTRP